MRTRRDPTSKARTPDASGVCPFCSLLCDDIDVQGERNLRVTSTRCPKARQGFEQKTVRIDPHMDGCPVTLEAAVARAAQILAKSRQPLISGLGTDIKGCRAALALAERCRAAVDHMHGEAMARNLRIMQQRGWILTTLAELKNRADCIVMVGTNAVDEFPRFFERFVWDQPSLSGLRANQRHIAYIGHALDTVQGRAPSGRAPAVLDCNGAEIADVLTRLRLRIAAPPAASVTRGRKRNATPIDRLAQQIGSAHYAVFVWSPGDLGNHVEAVVNQLCLLLSELNRRQRAAGVVLGGNDGGVSAVNACTWQTGFPLRVNFATGMPVYDPVLHAQDMMLGAGAADALLWISSFSARQVPAAASVPTIVLSRPSRRLASGSTVYIPVGTPGVDHAGNLLRTDGVVALPLHRLRNPVAPSVADVLTMIRERL